MTLIGTMLTALVIAREYERGTMESLFATPVTRMQILLGKLIPYYFLGMFSMTICALAGVFLFEVPLRGSVFALFVLSSTFLMPALGQGLLISILTKQQLLAAQTGLITGFLPAVILSGFIFDINSMPDALQYLTLAIPGAAFQHGASDGLPCRGHLARVPSAHGLYARAWRRLFGHHVQEAGEAVGCVNLGRGFPEKGSPSSFLPFSNEGAMGAACYRRSIL